MLHGRGLSKKVQKTDFSIEYMGLINQYHTVYDHSNFFLDSPLYHTIQMCLSFVAKDHRINTIERE